MNVSIVEVEYISDINSVYAPIRKNKPVKRYTFFSADTNIQVGDLLVVRSAAFSGSQDRLAIAKCAAVCDSVDGADAALDSLKPVVGVVDTTAFDSYTAKEAKRKELRAKIEAEMKNAQWLAVAEELAAGNPQLKQLLETYKAL